MLVLFSNKHRLHTPKFEYYDGVPTPYPEKPERIDAILAACRKLGLEVTEITEQPDLELLKEVHTPRYLEYLKNKCAEITDEQIMPSIYIHDTYAPLTPGTYDAALASAQLAVVAGDKMLAGQERAVYALCRPPGHHAEQDEMGGYCYVNNAAVVAEKLSKKGKVAILDIDFHHGNGTQEIFYDRDDVLYVSVHADPTTMFPYQSGFVDETGRGKGKGFNRNFPLPHKTTTLESYLETLKQALMVVSVHQPDYFVLSLGFDTFKDDPIAALGIPAEGYQDIARMIAGAINVPTAIIQEGGYNVEHFESLAENFLKGYLGLSG